MKWANIAMIGLAISSFPGACFSAFIAANSFRTTMPKVNPFLSVGIGALVAATLAVTGVVGKVIWVFVVIGALVWSGVRRDACRLPDRRAAVGPDREPVLIRPVGSRGSWASPSAQFNLVAGWIPSLAPYADDIPVPPVAAFVVGFVLYFACR